MRGGKGVTSEAERLLDWYDRAARDMPWRVGPMERKAGARPDPYHVWLSEIMLQQTTVAAVTDYFRRFVTRWPTVSALAAADDADVMAAWAGLGYYARARNLLKCARAVDADGGRFPATEGELRALPGIGPYTAAAIAAIAFDQPETVVDGNVERVIARYRAIATPMPAAKPEIRAAASRLTPTKRPGDYAQAVMDLGATICTPTKPACMICPLEGTCAARRLGNAETLPAKAAKKLKPTRLGHVYVMIRTDGALLLEERPAKGLLGGMMGFPGSDWSEEDPGPKPPIAADWTPSPETVRHTFTHFHLTLTVHVGEADADAVPDVGRFVPQRDFTDRSLPTVMRKGVPTRDGDTSLTPSPIAALPFWISLSFLPMIGLAATLGGLWLLAVPVYAFVGLTLLDAVTGHETRNPTDEEAPSLFWYGLITWIWLPIQLALIWGQLWWIFHGGALSTREGLYLMLGSGIVSGGVGIVYAHELMHRPGRLERALGEVLMISVLYGHFVTEHIAVHHRHVGTPKDAVTARYNESFYMFFLRVIPASFVSAWRVEAARMRARGLAVLGFRNPFWRYLGGAALMPRDGLRDWRMGRSGPLSRACLRCGPGARTGELHGALRTGPETSWRGPV